MPHRSHPRLVAEGRIVAGPAGLRFETQPDRRILELALDEDPAGFVGVPIRAEGVIIDENRFAILMMELVRAGADPT